MTHIHRTRQTQLAVGSRPRKANAPDVVEEMIRRTYKELNPSGA